MSPSIRSSDPLQGSPLASHDPFLRRLALALLGDEASADDAVQETLRRALGSKATGPIARPRAWLAQIMRHYVSGTRRRGAWREELEDGEGMSIAAAAADPAEITLRLERQRIVGEELRALDRTLRDALFLRYYEELSVRGVAEALGITLSAAESRVYRGREVLRERLEARFGPAGGRASDGSWMSALIPLIGGETDKGAPLQLLGLSQRVGWGLPVFFAAAALLVGTLVWARNVPVANPSVVESDRMDALAAVEVPTQRNGNRARGELVTEPGSERAAERAAAPPTGSFAFTAKVQDGTPVIGEPAVVDSRSSRTRRGPSARTFTSRRASFRWRSTQRAMGSGGGSWPTTGWAQPGPSSWQQSASFVGALWMMGEAQWRARRSRRTSMRRGTLLPRDSTRGRSMRVPTSGRMRAAAL